MNGYSDDPMVPVFHAAIPGNTVYLYDNGRGCGDTKVAAVGTVDHRGQQLPRSGPEQHDHEAVSKRSGASAASNTWTFTLIGMATRRRPRLTDDAVNAVTRGSATSDTHISGAGIKIAVQRHGDRLRPPVSLRTASGRTRRPPSAGHGTHHRDRYERGGCAERAVDAIVIKIDTSEPLPPAAPTLTTAVTPIPSGSTTSDGRRRLSGRAGWQASDRRGQPDGTGYGYGGGERHVDVHAVEGPVERVRAACVTKTNLAGTTKRVLLTKHGSQYLDNHQPVITSIVDAVGPGADIPMNQARPTIRSRRSTAQGVVGDTVYLYDNGRVCGRSSVNECAGAWAITINNSLDMGLNNTTATQFAAGWPSTVSNPEPRWCPACRQCIPHAHRHQRQRDSGGWHDIRHASAIERRGRRIVDHGDRQHGAGNDGRRRQRQRWCAPSLNCRALRTASM